MHLYWKLLQLLCSWSGYGPSWSLSSSSGIHPRPPTFYRTIIPNNVCHFLSVYLPYKPLVPKSVLGICDQFPRDPWIHFCNGYFKVNLFLKKLSD